MNKRNELKAKLQARHIQQQARQVNIPKAKRPAAVASIAATAPKKQKLDRKFPHPHHPHVHPAGEQFEAQFSPIRQRRPPSPHPLFRGACPSVVKETTLDYGRLPSTSATTDFEPNEEFINTAQEDATIEEPLAQKADSFERIAAEENDTNSEFVSRPDGWLYSKDGRMIDQAIAKLSMEQAFQFLQPSSMDLSLEASSRLIAFVAENFDAIDVDQAKSAIPALRVHRLKGASGAEKLLLRLVAKTSPSNTLECANKPPLFKRPPPLTKFSFDKMIPPPTVEEPPEIIAKAVESLSDGEIAKEKQKLEDIANEESRWAEKSADELLELLLSSKMDKQKAHALLDELLHKRPDVLDLYAPNFDAQVRTLFSATANTTLAAQLISQLAHCSSNAVIKTTVTFLLNNFDPKLSPVQVINFVASLCSEHSRTRLLISESQCFVLALYVLEDIETNHSSLTSKPLPDSELNCLESVVKFTGVVAFLLAEKPPGAELFYAFRRHYRAHIEALRAAPFHQSTLRRKHTLDQLYRAVATKFPAVSSQCAFFGMFDRPQHIQHIGREQFDRMMTATITEVFELVAKLPKGPETETALDKARHMMRFFRKNPNVQFARLMPLLANKLQLLIARLGSSEIKKTPACSLLLYSLDLIIVSLVSYQSSLASSDNEDNAKSVAIALQSLLQLMQQRKNRQIPLLGEKICTAIIQFLKINQDHATKLLAANSTLIGELSDRQLLNVPDRAILKRALMSI